ncbi:HNH endonuclease [Demequina aestuarii]|uniref:HNH endonuclease n=1 Tax=Demequina aestuarii TaxID=327095 RepID=UPI0007834558|nr:HNH endonuclease signature motif containing protein [Demequina aestuarii]
MASEAAVIQPAEIERVSTLVGELASRDVSGLSRDELLGLNASIARLERHVGALSSRCAGEIARRSTPDLPGGGLARREGHGNAKTMLSKVRGGTMAGAQKAMQAGEAFSPVTPPSAAPVHSPPRPKYPAVARASVAGELSVDAASLIVGGLNRLTDRLEDEALVALEERLVSKAVSMAAHEVQTMMARAVARADRAGHERRERENHEARYLWWRQDHEGTVVIHGQMDAVTAAPIIAVLEQMTTRDVRRQGRGTGRNGESESDDTRTVGQMRVDALHALARHSLGCTRTDRSGVRTTMVVRMSLSDLMSGDGLGSVDGIDQPVSVGQLRRLSGDAEIIPQVLGGDSEILDQGVRERLFTDAQRIALVQRDGGCAKCHAPPERCEAHHIRWWQHGGTTNLSNGVMLCTRCHHDIHRQGWEIVATSTSVSFIPPAFQDVGRTPSSGGSAALDVEVPLPPELDLPAITAEDEAMVHEWEREHREWVADHERGAGGTSRAPLGLLA